MGCTLAAPPSLLPPLMAGFVLFGRVLFLLPLLPGYRGYSSAQSPIFSTMVTLILSGSD